MRRQAGGERRDVVQELRPTDRLAATNGNNVVVTAVPGDCVGRGRWKRIGVVANDIEPVARHHGETAGPSRGFLTSAIIARIAASECRGGSRKQ